jgi:rSAM/selenodomain-associated transferase 1
MADRAGRPAAGRLLLQFTREPRLGAVKTRLQPLLGARGALALHLDLMRRTARTLCAVPDCRRELWVAGDPAHPLLRECAGWGFSGLRRQGEGDIGARMYGAIADGLGRSGRVVLVGSDCPDLDRAYLEAALQRLDDSDLVLGPALDGGYVLIGARRIAPALFQGIPWSTGAVLRETLARARRLGWRCALLEPRRDIDRPRDLAAWRAAGAQPPASTTR